MLVSLLPQKNGLKHAVTFTKHELNAVLNIYTYQVMKGVWRDYALDFTKSMALFSIYRHSGEQPLASVVKTPGNTSTGFVFEVFYDRKRLTRTPFIDKALEALKETVDPVQA